MFKSGGYFSGAIGFANGELNPVGDDAYIGDQNISGSVCIKGNNGDTRLVFVPYTGSTKQSIAIDGNGNMYVDGGKLHVTSGIVGNISGSAGSVDWNNVTNRPDVNNILGNYYTSGNILSNRITGDNSTSKLKIMFIVSSNYQPDDVPRDGEGFVLYLGDAGGAPRQRVIYFSYGTSLMYERNIWSGSWMGEWCRIIDSTSFVYSNGTLDINI